MDINKVDPHLIVLACGDEFIRLYDRRFLVKGDASNTDTNPNIQCVAKYAPVRASSSLPIVIISDVFLTICALLTRTRPHL